MIRSIFLVAMTILLTVFHSFSQTAMTNVYGRNKTSLNGKWEAIIDQFSIGNEMGIFKNRKPTKPTEFLEYSFENGLRLDVPGDFNSQVTELKLYESSVWYKKDFQLKKSTDKRYFIHFGAVNYLAEVYLNGKLLGRHEGGFFPFQFEMTNQLNNGANFIVVHTNNARSADAIPALKYDWWNYGGITREVFIVETPAIYLHDYTIQLEKSSMKRVFAKIQLSGASTKQTINVEIPEAKIKQTVTTDENGFGEISFDAKLQLWNTKIPKLYDVIISTPFETIKERIGFRSIQTRGTEILLNGEPVFLAGSNVHDEIASREGRAYSEADAAQLLREVKKLGSNFIRFTHYPPFEPMVRMAEEMGIMIWLEIPTWQKINFENPKTVALGENMLRELIARDKNRCAVILWSVANETRVLPARNKALLGYIDLIRQLDNTRLVTCAFDNIIYEEKARTYKLNDPVADKLDVVSVNKYFGWYHQWTDSPENMKLEIAPDRPFIYSEFGAEAQYGQDGDTVNAWTWGELYQEKIYKDHIAMFHNIANLRGVSPWVLIDFKSPYRMHQSQQNYWNRKGLISDKGFYKKAWYIIHDYYNKMQNDNKK
jgi:beta-glucuronidase